MAEAFMAYPELRHPFEETPIHPDGSVTILHQGKQTTLAESGDGPGLLIDPTALEGITGFTVKPEGACFEDLCFPLGEDVLVEQNGRTWFSLTAFADKVGQAYVADEDAGVWSFGDVPAQRERTLFNAKAPDIELTDRQGNVVRLADLKGKKALIVTWSSW